MKSEAAQPGPSMTPAALPRWRVAAFLLAALGVFAALYVISDALSTLDRLDQIEAQRDQWQKPAVILDALALRPGGSVVDLGCGSGYFSLKLSGVVGPRGKVYAVDLRRLSLTFLWIRAALRHDSNISAIRAKDTDPHIPSPVDAVLIVNTYHELEQRPAILDHLRASLISGGRLVIADRAGQPSGNAEGDAAAHRFDPERAAEELRAAGFDIVRRDDHLLDQPGEGPWWMIVARRP